MPTTHDDIVEALKSVISTALATVEGAPALEYDEPRLADPQETGVNRFRVSLIPGRRAPDTDQLAGSDLWMVTALFKLGLHGVGADDDARQALMSQMTGAIATALATDWSLGGVASFARLIELHPDTSKEKGYAPENLFDIGIEVEFDSLSPVG